MRRLFAAERIGRRFHGHRRRRSLGMAFLRLRTLDNDVPLAAQFGDGLLGLVRAEGFAVPAFLVGEEETPLPLIVLATRTVG